MATTNLAAGIPLYIFPDAVDGYKIGIAVSVNSGRTYQMHEFDTGSQGVWPPYNASWFNPGTPFDAVVRNTRNNGITYNAQPTTMLLAQVIT
jgi:hypothetical protein